MSGAQVAQDLGLPADTLWLWVKEHRREYPYPFLRPWHTTQRDRDRWRRHRLAGKPWPIAWTPLDEYADGGSTLNETHRVSRAEQTYEILLHWHEQIMVIDANAAARNWCPQCPADWGDPVARFQIPPERQPFDGATGALGQWDAWIRQESHGDWLTTPEVAQQLNIHEYTHLIAGDPHSTLARLTERLAATMSPGLRFCGHLQERTTGPLNTTPIFVPQWAVAKDPRRPCPLCLLGLPAWRPYIPQTASLPEDVNVRPDGDLYATVREVLWSVLLESSHVLPRTTGRLGTSIQHSATQTTYGKWVGQHVTYGGLMMTNHTGHPYHVVTPIFRLWLFIATTQFIRIPPSIGG